MSKTDFPPPLEEWTLETVRRVVAEHQHEPDWLDYKEALVPHRASEKKDEHRDSIRRCACAMSNTNGGFIVFGVKDKGDAEDRLVGIDLTKDLRKQFGDLLDKIDPNIRGFDAKTIPFNTDKPGEGVWVVQLPVSPLRPHMLGGKFYKRMAAGKCEAMSTHEVREQIILSQETIRRIVLLEANVRRMQTLAEEMREQEFKPHQCSIRYSAESTRLVLAGVADIIGAEGTGKLLALLDSADGINRRLGWLQAASLNHQFDWAKESSGLLRGELEVLARMAEEIAPLLGELVTEIVGDEQ